MPTPEPDPGLFGPDSMTWRLHGDPVLATGGLRSLLMQSLHPDVVAGFRPNSDYLNDWWGRLSRTTDYVGLTSFGTTEEVARAARGVRYAHAKFRFADPVDGRERRLDEPELLMWVHCTFAESVLHVARRSGMAITADEADRYYAEQVRFAELVGLKAADVPADVASMTDYMRSMVPVLRLDAIGREVVSSLFAPPMRPAVEFGTPARLGWSTLVGIVFATLPPHALDLFPAAFRTGPQLVHPAAVDVALRALRLTGRGVGAVVPGMRRSPMEAAARQRLGLA